MLRIFCHAWSDHCDFLTCLCLQCATHHGQAQYQHVVGLYEKSGAVVAISAVKMCTKSFENNKLIDLMLFITHGLRVI